MTTDNPTTEYAGHCHCGATQFSVAGNVAHSFKCNCSFCVRRATTLMRVEESRFALHSDESAMGTYGARDFSDHFFCKTCGIHCYTRFRSDKGRYVIVNVGCLDGVDSLALQPALFDGAGKM